MLSDVMASKISDQINNEFFSAHLYLALSTEAEAMNLRGTAAWFSAKYGEEMTHANKMIRYLLDQGAEVKFSNIPSPPDKAGAIVPMFERTLNHERGVTASINALLDHALSEKDHATGIFLQWFVTEQIEEEATVNDILGRLQLFGDTGQALLMIDNELGASASSIGQASAAA